jgi:hypothetical protein
MTNDGSDDALIADALIACGQDRSLLEEHESSSESESDEDEREWPLLSARHL